MAKVKRVVAHFMHESERDEALALLSEAEASKAFVLGVTDAAGIKQLKKSGLIVDVVADVAPAPARTTKRGKRAGKRGAAKTGARVTTAPASYPALVRAYVSGPLLPKRIKAIKKTGCALVERAEDGGWVVRAKTKATLSGLAKLAFIDRIDKFQPGPVGPGLTGKRSAAGDDGPTTKVYDILFKTKAAKKAAERWLGDQKGTQIVDSSALKLRVLCSSSTILRMSRDGVELASEVRDRRLSNDRARRIVHSDEVEPSLGNRERKLTGRGEIVAVADSGIDEDHPDFRGRIVKAVGLGRAGNPSDPHGHGTHVAGTVLGSGHASGGKLRGVAPKAKLYFQSVMDSDGRLGGLPFDLSKLFGPAYRAGARVHNNSWGADLEGRYTGDSLEVDRFIYDHPDMVVVIAAGNAGTTRDVDPNLGRLAGVGNVEWKSLGSPATSKNALVVGASRSDRKSGGLSRHTHHQVWQEDFPMVGRRVIGVAAEKISGDPNCLAGFSSRGPTDDERMKPDVVAPGTDILSTRSRLAPNHSFWGIRSADNNHYAYMGGTSMAAPHVSGCAALVREYYRTLRGHDKPSAALVKATLVNGAIALDGDDAIADHAGNPNMHQGFGRVSLSASLPGRRERVQLAFIDTWLDDKAGMVGGDVRQYELEIVEAGKPLRFCMAYTDHPGRALQNMLEIMVIGPKPARGKPKHWRANAHAPKGMLKGHIRKNNLQVIRIADAPAGVYTLKVSSYEIPHAPQHFALVVTGAMQRASRAPAGEPAWASPRLLKRRK